MKYLSDQELFIEMMEGADYINGEPHMKVAKLEKLSLDERVEPEKRTMIRDLLNKLKSITN